MNTADIIAVLHPITALVFVLAIVNNVTFCATVTVKRAKRKGKHHKNVDELKLGYKGITLTIKWVK